MGTACTTCHDSTETKPIDGGADSSNSSSEDFHDYVSQVLHSMNNNKRNNNNSSNNNNSPSGVIGSQGERHSSGRTVPSPLYLGTPQTVTGGATAGATTTGGGPGGGGGGASAPAVPAGYFLPMCTRLRHSRSAKGQQAAVGATPTENSSNLSNSNSTKDKHDAVQKWLASCQLLKEPEVALHETPTPNITDSSTSLKCHGELSNVGMRSINSEKRSVRLNITEAEPLNPLRRPTQPGVPM